MKTKLSTFWQWIKEAVVNLGKFLSGLILIPVALFLIVISGLAAIIHYFSTIGKKKQKARDFLTFGGRFSFNVSLSLNHLGNVLYGPLWNWLFLKEVKQFPYGKHGESLSEITGWNYKIDNLTEWGLNLRHDLDLWDNDHCEKARVKAVLKAQDLLDRNRAVITRIETIEHTKEFNAKYS